MEQMIRCACHFKLEDLPEGDSLFSYPDTRRCSRHLNKLAMKYLSQLRKCISGAIVFFTCALSPQTFSAEITPEQAKAKVDDSSHLNRYFGQEFGSIGQLIGTDNEAAEKRLTGLIQVVSEMKPENEDSKALVPRAHSAIEFYQKQIKAAKTPINEIIERLNINPND
jgi:di/tripeptidase